MPNGMRVVRGILWTEYTTAALCKINCSLLVSIADRSTLASGHINNRGGLRRRMDDCVVDRVFCCAGITLISGIFEPLKKIKRK